MKHISPSDFSSALKIHAGQREIYDSLHRFKVVVAGRRWGKCLAAGTRITMADGTVRTVESVDAGDSVLTVNEITYKIESKTVQHRHDNGVKETIIIRTAGRNLRCTSNHPLLVNNKWVEAKDIKIGDLVAVPKATSTFGTIRQSDQEVDYLAIWLAEGADYTISNGTPEIIDRLQSAVSHFGLMLKPLANFDWYVTDGLGSGRSKARPVNAARDFIKKLGLWGCKSKTKFIPAWVYNLPEDQLARFLNLFIACDGAITLRSKKTWALEIGLANETLVRQLAELLMKFGIRGQIRHKIHKKTDRFGAPYESWRFIASAPEAIIAFADRIGALSKDVQIAKARTAALSSRGNANAYLPIEHDAFVDHLVYTPVEKGKYGGYNCTVARDLPCRLREGLTSWRKQTPSRCSTKRFDDIREFSDGFFDPIADGDLAWEEIIAVDIAEQIQTYDLTIEANHNFFAEGICTHNTQLSKLMIIRRSILPRQLIWYVAPTYGMARTILWDELKDAIPRRLIANINETRMTIRLINRTKIELKGADKPDSLRGVGLHLVVIDEAQDIQEDTWFRVLRPTLATTAGDVLVIGTPKLFNWLYKLYEMGQRGEVIVEKGKTYINPWKSWQKPTITSPFVPREEIEAARADMDEKSFRQEFEASFETMSGRVYYTFERAVHVGTYKFNPYLPIWIGMDFNIDPMSAVVLQPQRNGEVWIVDECVIPSSNTQEMAEELGRRYFKYQKTTTIYPDPAGASRSTKGRGESDLDILRESGFIRLKYRRKHPKVTDRVNAVNRMFKTANGSIKMRVDSTCKHTISSLEQTIYKKGTREVDKSRGQEHITDGLGYCVDLEFQAHEIKVMGISI